MLYDCNATLYHLVALSPLSCVVADGEKAVVTSKLCRDLLVYLGHFLTLIAALFSVNGQKPPTAIRQGNLKSISHNLVPHMMM